MNPELQRLLWLDVTTSRVGAVLFALAAIVGLGWLIDGEQLASTTATFTLAAFILFTVAWGANQVSRALLDELRARTWDQQRMSALSPWAMTWGKLAGATALPWLAGGLALALHALAAPQEGLAWNLLLYGAGALLIHGLALFGSLLMVQRGAHERASMVLRLVGSLLAGLMLYAFFQGDRSSIEWFGRSWPTLPFGAVVVATLAAWLLLGCQRLMSEELQVRTLPWALPGFVLTLSVLLAGLAVDANTAAAARPGVIAVFAVAIGLAAAYFGAFALRNDALLPRRLAVAAARRDWQRIATLLPPWAIALLCALVAVVVVQITWQPRGHLLQFLFSMRGATLAAFACGVRDLFVIYALGCSVREDRGELVSLSYLALVYWLLPGIFTLTGAHALGALLTPLPWVMPDRALPALLLQAAAAVGFAWWAYARRMRPVTAAADARS